ncbi:hypothetical protein LEN26_001441 [Aphanomyces euteiches]|nr:hypothetical protein LEN26_001441 [Aphanomyces euteiches]
MTPQLEFSSAVNMYTPVVGRVPTKIDLERAINEFHRLENQQVDEMDVKVHFAKDVNLFQWQKSTLGGRFKYVRFTAVVQAGVTADTVNACTTCDIFIIQVVFGTPHASAVAAMIGQLYNYNMNECNEACQSGGGRMQFTIGGNGNIADREPDTAFTPPGTKIPTILFEFRPHHQSFVALDEWCRELDKRQPQCKKTTPVLSQGANKDKRRHRPLKSIVFYAALVAEIHRGSLSLGWHGAGIATEFSVTKDRLKGKKWHQSAHRMRNEECNPMAKKIANALAVAKSRR